MQNFKNNSNNKIQCDFHPFLLPKNSNFNITQILTQHLIFRSEILVASHGIPDLVTNFEGHVPVRYLCFSNVFTSILIIF